MSPSRSTDEAPALTHAPGILPPQPPPHPEPDMCRGGGGRRPRAVYPCRPHPPPAPFIISGSPGVMAVKIEGRSVERNPCPRGGGGLWVYLFNLLTRWCRQKFVLTTPVKKYVHKENKIVGFGNEKSCFLRKESNSPPGYPYNSLLAGPRVWSRNDSGLGRRQVLLAGYRLTLGEGRGCTQTPGGGGRYCYPTLM